MQLIILFAFLMQAQMKQLASSDNANVQATLDKLLDKLVDKLLDQILGKGRKFFNHVFKAWNQSTTAERRRHVRKISKTQKQRHIGRGARTYESMRAKAALKFLSNCSGIPEVVLRNSSETTNASMTREVTEQLQEKERHSQDYYYLQQEWQRFAQKWVEGAKRWETAAKKFISAVATTGTWRITSDSTSKEAKSDPEDPITVLAMRVAAEAKELDAMAMMVAKTAAADQSDGFAAIWRTVQTQWERTADLIRKPPEDATGTDWTLLAAGWTTAAARVGVQAARVTASGASEGGAKWLAEAWKSAEFAWEATVAALVKEEAAAVLGRKMQAEKLRNSNGTRADTDRNTAETGSELKMEAERVARLSPGFLRAMSMDRDQAWEQLASQWATIATEWTAVVRELIKAIASCSTPADSDVAVKEWMARVLGEASLIVKEARGIAIMPASDQLESSRIAMKAVSAVWKAAESQWKKCYQIGRRSRGGRVRWVQLIGGRTAAAAKAVASASRVTAEVAGADDFNVASAWVVAKHAWVSAVTDLTEAEISGVAEIRSRISHKRKGSEYEEVDEDEDWAPVSEEDASEDDLLESPQHLKKYGRRSRGNSVSQSEAPAVIKNVLSAAEWEQQWEQLAMKWIAEAKAWARAATKLIRAISIIAVRAMEGATRKHIASEDAPESTAEVCEAARVITELATAIAEAAASGDSYGVAAIWRASGLQWESTQDVIKRPPQDGTRREWVLLAGGWTAAAARVAATAARLTAQGDVVGRSENISAAWTLAEAAWEAAAKELTKAEAAGLAMTDNEHSGKMEVNRSMPNSGNQLFRNRAALLATPGLKARTSAPSLAVPAYNPNVSAYVNSTQSACSPQPPTQSPVSSPNITRSLSSAQKWEQGWQHLAIKWTAEAQKWTKPVTIEMNDEVCEAARATADVARAIAQTAASVRAPGVAEAWSKSRSQWEKAQELLTRHLDPVNEESTTTFHMKGRIAAAAKAAATAAGLLATGVRAGKARTWEAWAAAEIAWVAAAAECKKQKE
eukprot:gnl/MRDRNA2_/MRDRNA2_106815_c0_seq1.p1 gnl/MRDRNA2_/MRDRNA2_106815_c0~~gnl/MRDRNA2_/MRDRNA2_106815_c0_seq1.p1  ORF type:complete len:1028 (+),score=240.94 gnl/MRDRNA2_/MRDRNA2_106815_c0_seq1:156-3239(+)